MKKYRLNIKKNIIVKQYSKTILVFGSNYINPRTPIPKYNISDKNISIKTYKKKYILIFTKIKIMSINKKINNISSFIENELNINSSDIKNIFKCNKNEASIYFIKLDWKSIFLNTLKKNIHLFNEKDNYITDTFFKNEILDIRYDFLYKNLLF